MPEELRIEVGHSPSNPTTDQKVRFFAEATGNVSKVEILINGRLATTCAGRHCSCLVGPFPAGTVTYYANAYGERRMFTSGERQFTVRAARPAKPPRPARPARPAKPPEPTKTPEPARRFRPAKPPEPEESSTISGRITGETHLVKGVIAQNLDQPSQYFTASIATNGEFEFSDLPDGRYHVSPTSAEEKTAVISEPRYREVRCQGGQSHTVNFEIKGIDVT